MAKTLKVYGWTGQRNEARQPSGHSQTREIMAASSAAEVRRVTGMSRASWEHSGCETGNEAELRVALANPGRVLWIPLNASQQARTQPEQWTVAK